MVVRAETKTGETIADRTLIKTVRDAYEGESSIAGDLLVADDLSIYASTGQTAAATMGFSETIAAIHRFRAEAAAIAEKIEAKTKIGLNDRICSDIASTKRETSGLVNFSAISSGGDAILIEDRIYLYIAMGLNGAD